MGSERRLLLSIHDVTPTTLTEVDRLHDHLCVHGGARSLALLVVPDHWNSRPIAGDAGFKAWLRARHLGGDEIILHGWRHRDDGGSASGLTGFKQRRMTAGEGEFLTLAHDEALRRLNDGRALLEDMIGAPVPGFVAPAWLYGPAARAAIAEAGFAFAEDHFRLWSPQDGTVMARGPVITWASRSHPRMLSSLAVAATARALLNRLPTVRIGVHPGDVGEPRIMASIRETAFHFSHSHGATRYIDLVRSCGMPATPQPAFRRA